MTVLKSKTALFDWYVGLKTNLKSNKITVIEFEKEIIDTIVAFFEGKKEVTPTKADLIADILNAVGYDHLFTKNWSVHLAYVLGESGATNNEVVKTALDNFTSVQVAGWQRKEKEAAKTFPEFTTYDALKNWLHSTFPAINANRNLGQPQQVIDYAIVGEVIATKLGKLNKLLDPADPQHYRNIGIIDQFVSVFTAMPFPLETYGLLIKVLHDLYTNPAVTPNITAFVHSKDAAKELVAQPSATERAQQRADHWMSQNPGHVSILETFAERYCPVATALQLARSELTDFIVETARSVLIAISNPVTAEYSTFLLTGTRTDTLELDNGVVAINTQIKSNGVVELRIYKEYTTQLVPRGLNANYQTQRRENYTHSQQPGFVGAVIDQLIHMWPIPNRPPRYDNNRFNNGPTVLDDVLGKVGFVADGYNVVASVAALDDYLMVVLH